MKPRRIAEKSLLPGFRQLHCFDSHLAHFRPRGIGRLPIRERTDQDSCLERCRNAFPEQSGVQFFSPSRIGEYPGLQVEPGEQPGQYLGLSLATRYRRGTGAWLIGGGNDG